MREKPGQVLESRVRRLSRHAGENWGSHSHGGRWRHTWMESIVKHRIPED